MKKPEELDAITSAISISSGNSFLTLLHEGRRSRTIDKAKARRIARVRKRLGAMYPV
jgi:hypothetical protein